MPLLNDQGMVAHWRIIDGDDPFFQVTKALHNGLQGAPRELDDKEKARYLATSRANAAGFDDEYDFVFVHDPQPAALLQFAGKGKARWIWRSHIDTSRANAGVWQFLRPFLADYDAAVFTMAEFVPSDMPTPVVEIIPPAIDPQNPKNLAAARGDRAPDPGVDRRAHRAPAGHPGVALRPVEGSAGRDRGVSAGARRRCPTSSWRWSGRWRPTIRRAGTCTAPCRKAIGRDKRIHVFTNLVGVGNVEVNAFQALSKLVIQKSLREGFGLVVAEALWKGTPVVAGRAGGIPLQMADGTGGFLVDTVDGVRAGDGRAAEGSRCARRRWGPAAASGCAGTS